MECTMSTDMVDVCETKDPGAALTCVVEDHPACLEQICASWADSAAFCSRACMDDADCPEASSCRDYLDIAICVPDDLASD